MLQTDDRVAFLALGGSHHLSSKIVLMTLGSVKSLLRYHIAASECARKIYQDSDHRFAHFEVPGNDKIAQARV